MEEELKNELSRILRSRERVLVCLPESAPRAQWWKNTLKELDTLPECPGEGAQWGVLLRRCFEGRHTAAIGAPGVLLGLGKLSRYTGVPLCIRSVLLTQPCPDWITAAIEQSLDCRVYLLRPGRMPSGKLWEQEQALLRWSSVLDARLVRGSYGLELEAVVFPGKKLPAFPNCARQRVNVWDFGRDVPFSILYDTKNWNRH